LMSQSTTSQRSGSTLAALRSRDRARGRGSALRLDGACLETTEPLLPKNTGRSCFRWTPETSVSDPFSWQALATRHSRDFSPRSPRYPSRPGSSGDAVMSVGLPHGEGADGEPRLAPQRGNDAPPSAAHQRRGRDSPHRQSMLGLRMAS
jgi:hypothetical protein